MLATVDRPTSIAVDTVRVLELTAWSIWAEGWVSKARAEAEGRVPTAERIAEALREGRIGRCEDRETAWAARAWMLGLEPENAFERNLKAAAQGETCRLSAVGVLAAGTWNFLRAREERRRAETWEKLNAESRHVGTIGQRVELDVQIVGVQKIEKFGRIVYKYSMVDATGGDVFVSWRTRPLRHRIDGAEVAAGEEVRVRATVRRHAEYRGTAQTVVSCVRLVEDE